MTMLSIPATWRRNAVTTDMVEIMTLSHPLLQNLYSAQIEASSSQRRWRIARWGTWLAGVGKEVSFETAFERANGWYSSLIFPRIEFQIVRAANLKALRLRPTALAVKGTCNRLNEAER